MAQPPVAPPASTMSAAGGLGGAGRSRVEARRTDASRSDAWFGDTMLFCDWINRRTPATRRG